MFLGHEMSVQTSFQDGGEKDLNDDGESEVLIFTLQIETNFKAILSYLVENMKRELTS